MAAVRENGQPRTVLHDRVDVPRRDGRRRWPADVVVEAFELVDGLGSEEDPRGHCSRRARRRARAASEVCARLGSALSRSYVGTT